MNIRFSGEYLQTACTELETLEGMGSWDVDDCEYDMNVIRSTWDFKLNQNPDGLINKFKAILCPRRDMLLEGIYFLRVLRVLFNGPPLV